jgi:hypothetical protein
MGGLWQWTLALFGKRKAGGPADITLSGKESAGNSPEGRPEVVLEVPGMN